MRRFFPIFFAKFFSYKFRFRGYASNALENHHSRLASSWQQNCPFLDPKLQQVTVFDFSDGFKNIVAST